MAPDDVARLEREALAAVSVLATQALCAIIDGDDEAWPALDRARDELSSLAFVLSAAGRGVEIAHRLARLDYLRWMPLSHR